MKVLMLNASPWANGNISMMMSAMGEEMLSRGWEVDSLWVAEMSFRPCMGCMKCRRDGDCCLGEDDAHRLARRLGDYDLIVVGAPCYWGNMPGTLKMLFDRMVYAMIDSEAGGLLPKPRLKGRRAIIITASTTPWPLNRLFGQTGGVVRGLRAIFRQCGIRIAGTYQKGNTRKSPEPTARDLEKVIRLLPKK